MHQRAGLRPRARRSPWAARLAGPVATVGVALGAMATLACWVLAGCSLVQWFAWPDAGWGHLGWFAYGVMMSAAPWMSLNRGNAWATLCMTAMGAGAMWFAWQRLGATGPLVCKPADSLCRIAEGVRLGAGEHAVVALFGLAGLGLVWGGLRYALWDRPRG